MRFDTTFSALRSLRLLLAIAGCVAGVATARAQTTDSSSSDPRAGLAGAHMVDAAEAISNLTLIAHRPRPHWPTEADVQPYGEIATVTYEALPGRPGQTVQGIFGSLAHINSDLAFRGNYVFQGSFNGFSIWDISDVSNPVLHSTYVCPGGQGDPSVSGNLLFISVEERRARIDCGTQGANEVVSPERFNGVRIFDITDIDHPKQVAAVQTCRGSHTHTLVPDPKDPKVLYVYVSSTAPVRSAAELPGCSTATPDSTNRVDPNTSLFRIEVIRVPLNAPQDAKVINAPRIFASTATGAINGLRTDMCHDIAVYPAFGIAAGACSGNGILLDIRDPANPKRIADIADPNFSFFHSATFSNDASKVIYTDEWGGGFAPRCRASDPKNWGGDAVFTRVGAKLQLASYYKLPAPQGDVKNCVSHNGSLIPVPGRDILVQAWYQGGISVFDFTDAAHPKEIAYFDRGPLDANRLVFGGYWSAFWYNGHIYGSDIVLGLDVFSLKPSEYLSQHEIDAANAVHWDQSNPTDQQKIVWPASFAVACAYLDQLTRDQGLSSQTLSRIASDLDNAERLDGTQRAAALKKLTRLVDSNAHGTGDSERARALAAAIKDLATVPSSRTR